MDDLQKAEELLQKLAGAIKTLEGYESIFDPLHYEVVSFLSRRGRIYP